MDAAEAEATATHRRISLVVLIGVPFTEQNYKRSGVAYLEHLFDVTVIDCNKWLYPTYSNLNYQRHPYQKRIEVTSMKILLDVLANVQPLFAIDCLSASPMKRLIRLELSRCDIPFVIKRSGLCPHLSRKQLFVHLLRFNPIDLFRRLLRYLTIPNASVRAELSPDIALVAGRNARDGAAMPRLAEIAISADDVHYLNEARQTHSARPISMRNTILFLDDCIAEAKDYVLIGLPFPMDAQKYYALLRKSFDILEQTCSCKVVVAAHPDGLHIPGYAEKFGLREVRFGQTPYLALGARLVLGHASTALSFAVLEKIPVVLLTCRELNASFKGPHILAMKHALGSPLVFMDGEGEQLVAACREAMIDEARYEAYTEEFLMMPQGHEHQPWEAFIKYANSCVDRKNKYSVQDAD